MDAEKTHEQVCSEIEQQLGEFSSLELIQRVYDAFNRPDMQVEDQCVYDVERVRAGLMVLNYTYLRIADEWKLSPGQRGFCN